MQIETQIAAKIAQYPHLSFVGLAITYGRNDGFDGLDYSSEFTNRALRQAYRSGLRQARSEVRLDADTEWDA